jgi:hypothetical protein
METTRPEIQKQLTYRQEMIDALRERLYPLEIQRARQGYDTPPQIVAEIKSIATQIKEHEYEINRLEKPTVEDQLPRAEAEYCLMLAKTWSLSQGQPTVIDRIHLEVIMLQLGIDSQRAKELEYEIRSKLIKESILKI